MARCLELGESTSPVFSGGNGEGDQRGRYVQIQEGAGHGVLAADGGGAQLQLRVQQRPAERQKGLPQRSGSLRSFSKNSWKER